MAAHEKSTLDGLYKDVYGDSLESLVPDFGILTKKISFSTAKKTGRDFVVAVKLSNEHGFTYGSGLAPLAGIISSDVEDAKVRGSSFTLQTGFSYDAAANMVAGGKEAFISGTKFKFMAMMESATARLEQQIVYGGLGLGTMSDSTNVDSTHTTIQISAASWAPGTWSATEGAALDVYNGNTKVNTNGPVTVDSVDAVAKTVTVSGVLADITAIDALAAGAYSVEYAGSHNNEMVGLRSIAASTGSLYGVGGSYGLWKGNVVAAGAVNLTLKKIYQSLVPAIGKGLLEDVTCLVSPATFATLANDEASLRQYNTQAKKADRGFGEIEFTGANGKISVLAHPMAREGEAILFPENRAERIGATDLTFKTPGREDEMFLQMAGHTGYECRLYSEQALFLPCPAKCTVITGISNA
jgi:hypothetical protein